MDFSNLEARANNENRPELKRAMLLVKRKVPEIEKLIREGHGPHYTEIPHNYNGEHK